MSQEDGFSFCPQEYQGMIVVRGTVARIVDLSAKDLNPTFFKGSGFAISLKNGDQYHNERIGKWIEGKHGKAVKMIIDLPFPEQPTNYLISLISEADEKDLVSFEAESY